jgi:hypothetical protein
LLSGRGIPDLALGLHGWEMYDLRLDIVGTITATALMDEPRDTAANTDMFGRLEEFAVYGDPARSTLVPVTARYSQL